MVKEDPVVRFATAPGQQLQVDWIEYKRDGLAAFVATLGYSRAAFIEYMTDERVETLVACHVYALEFVGGVPRELLYDNINTVVLERDGHGPGLHRFHPTLWDMAKHYNFQPRLCRPYRAKTKGKVERFNGYLRHSFHIPLRTRLRQHGLRLDRETANVEVARWLRDAANARVHAETGAVPAVRLDAKRATLQALPAPYRGAVRAARPQGPAAAATLSRVSVPAHTAPPVTAQHALSMYHALLEQA